MKNHKIYFYRTLILLPTTFLISVFFLVLLILKLKHPMEDNYNRAYVDKINLLKSTNFEKRIIFIGGSNLAFGLDSLKIEREFTDYKVINTAVHAGIGFRYMLSDIKEYLKKDDIVILVPEYSHFYNSGVGNYAFWEVISSKESLENIDFTILYKSLPSLLQGVKGILVSNPNEEFDKKFTYDRRGFNKQGDYINHWKYSSKEKILPEKINKIQLTDSIFNYLENFMKEMEDKEICVKLLPPVFQKTSYDLNEAKIKEIQVKLKRQFEINPDVFKYEDELFFDTPYHLNKKGVEKRTNQIIDYIKTNQWLAM